MKLFRWSSLALLTLSIVSGCSNGPAEEKLEVKSNQIVDTLRKSLEEMAKSGKTGSGLTALGADINGIKASDSAKGNALHEDYMKMQRATKPQEVRAIAKEMLGKL